MDDPNIFLGLEPGAESRICNDAKEMYDYSMRVIGSQNVGCLNQLIVDGFDNEQIWQQIEMYNSSVLGHHEQQLNFLTNAGKSRLRKKHNKLSEKRSLETKKVTFQSNDENGECDTKQPKIKSRQKLASQHVADLDEEAVLDEENVESEEEKELEELLQKVTGKNMKDSADDSDTGDDFGDVDDEDQLSDSDDNKNNPDSDVDEDDVDFNVNDPSVDKLKKKLRTMNDKTKLKGAKSIVDDKFFKLSEMEAFLDEQDKKAARSKPDADESEESDDEDMSDDDDETTQTNYTYKDFFDMPDGNETLGGDDQTDDEDEDDDTNDDDDEDDDQDDIIGDEGSEDEEEKAGTEKHEEKACSDDGSRPSMQEKSSFERRQEKLKRQIADLEKKNIDTKSWQMTGEVFSSARPENSLLQETLEFDYMTRQAPVITEETTKSLEDLIMQRIKDKAWDDVERKAKPSDKMIEYSKRVVVDQEKSKIGLSEIYEQQFLKQSEKSAETKKEDPKHEDIRSSMNSLFLKLDALANFHYTPKPVVNDVKIVSNLPALTVEEKLPSAVSDAALRAPEEIQAKTKREFIGATEMTKTDKLRARRLKKKLQHEKRLKREEKEKTSKSKSEKLDGNAKKVPHSDQSDKKKRKQKLGETMNEKTKSAKMHRKMHSA